MSFETTSVGLDVHARSTTACAILDPTGETTTTRLPSDHTRILDWLHTLPEPVRAVYEAGPTGFALARALAAAGIDCTVAAPSKLQRPSGDRIKTDTRDTPLNRKNSYTVILTDPDAAHLARLLRLGEIRILV